MIRSGPAHAFILRVASLARAEGIDAERLAREVADHLAMAIEQHVAEGCDAPEAERRAIEGFGEAETLVTAVTCSVKGGAMRTTIRTAAHVAALAGTTALVVAHVIPSQSVSGTWFERTAVLAMVVMAAAAVALGATRWRSNLGGGSLETPGIPWVAAVVALGALAAREAQPTDLGFVVLQPGGRLYLGTIGALALLVAVGARLARSGWATGAGLIVAGALSLALDGAWSHAWKPMGGIGGGQANTGIELIVAGWAMGAASWFTGRGGAVARGKLGGLLVSAGRPLAQST